MATKKYVSLEKLTKYDELVKSYIGTQDEAVLAAAKKYAEDLGVNYDAAGSAVTEAGKVQTKLNEEVARATAAEEANAAAAKKAQDEVDALELVVDGKADQTALDALSNKVGTVPADQTVMGIITKIQQDAYDDTELRGLISGLESSKADKTQVATDITNAVAAETSARETAVAGVQGAVDALSGTHATDKAALEGAIALKADKTTLEEVSAVANAAVKQADYDVKVKALEDEDIRIAGLVTTEKARAEGVEAGLRTDVDAIKADYLKAADKTELSNAIAAEAERAAGVEESLQTQINTIMNNPDTEGVINSINEFTQYIADHGEIAEGFRTDIDANAEAIEDLAEEVAATYETKEDAAVKYDELAAEVAAKAVQANWAQNDATAADYVKNRTHYEEVSYEVILEETEITTEANQWGKYCSGKFAANRYPYLKERVLVTFNGEEYECDYRQVFKDTYGIGNGTLGSNDALSSEHPFFVKEESGYSPQLSLFTEEPGTYTLKIVSLTNTVVTGVKQLDEKFIPETIARVSEVEALEGRMDTAEGAIEAVEGRLDVVEPKVDELTGKVSTLEGKMEAVEGAVATKAEAQALADAVAALEDVDTGLGNRIAALEAKHGDGEGTVESMIAAAKSELQGELATAIEGAKTDASNKDAVVLAEAQKGIDAVQLAVDTHTGNADIHVTTADKSKWNAALQASDVVTGSTNGTISVKGNEVAVAGLGSAAFVATTAFDAAGSASTAETNAKTHANELFAQFEECSEGDIKALFGIA